MQLALACREQHAMCNAALKCDFLLNTSTSTPCRSHCASAVHSLDHSLHHLAHPLSMHRGGPRLVGMDASTTSELYAGVK